MNEEIVKIKGTKSGLQLIFQRGASFAAIERDITQKLETGDEFFTRGTVVQIAPDALRKEDAAKLKRLFNRHGLLFRATVPGVDAFRHSPTSTAEPLANTVAAQGEEMLVLDRTVRGGEEIKTTGSVMVVGNVNPGAQIIAGGSVDIRGTCRGIVHAGAFGNNKAFVIADRLMPLQIRIANFVARSPDQIEESDRAEKASIKDGQIVIEPIDR